MNQNFINNLFEKLSKVKQDLADSTLNKKLSIRPTIRNKNSEAAQQYSESLTPKKTTTPKSEAAKQFLLQAQVQFKVHHRSRLRAGKTDQRKKQTLLRRIVRLLRMKLQLFKIMKMQHLTLSMHLILFGRRINGALNHRKINKKAARIPSR